VSAAGGAQPQRPTTESRRAASELVVARFLRAFQVLLKSTRLYDRDHPQVEQSLSAAEAQLRAAQGTSATHAVGIRATETGFVNGGSQKPIPDPKGDLRGLAQELARTGIETMIFPAETHLGELAALAALLARKPGQHAARKDAEAAAPDGDRLPAEGPFTGDWNELRAAYRIEVIRINEPLEEPKADATIASLAALVLAEASAASPEVERAAETPAELMASLRLLAQLGGILARHAGAPPQETLALLRNLIGSAAAPAVRQMERAMTRNPLDPSEALEAYLERLAGAMVLEFVSRQFEEKRIAPPAVRGELQRLSAQVNALAAPGAAGLPAVPALLRAPWTEETWAEHLHEQFWMELHASEKHAVLHSHEAWCVPVATLERYLNPAVGGTDASLREARATMLDFSRCLLAKETPARLATATGLSELAPLVARLWPEKLPDELVDRVVWALTDERAPEVAGLLSAATASLAQTAFERAQFATLDRILETLEKAPHDDAHAHLKMLAGSILADQRWDALVTAAVQPRHLDASLARILGRDPDRLVESLSAHLAAGELHALPAMSRLVRTIGEPAIGALVSHLFDPRAQLASASIKLLAATQPDRLVSALPRALPGWDWNLQDLAVSELISVSRTPAELQECARAFLAAVQHGHPLVVPMMLDQIGVAREKNAVAILVEIAAGREERLKDVFVRIKAVEALGRIGPASGSEAADVLRQILREKRGLTHTEPAGLRAAAEEALGLIENWPSAARVRTAREALEKSGVTHARPRRYLRIPLDSPLPAKICGPPEVSARVRTISLGGALLESPRRLSIGEALEVEIKAGLRSIHSKAVVRNVAPAGNGIEFVHMKQDDREKLRKLVSKLLRD
jgi:hypothetical protein